MGNTITNRIKNRNSSTYTSSIFDKSTLQCQCKSTKQYELRSKTLPARSRNAMCSTLENDLDGKTTQTFPTQKPKLKPTPSTPPQPNGETSRVLFLLYLIHRTWNVLTDTKCKGFNSNGEASKKPPNRDSFYETESNFSLTETDLYGSDSQHSQHSVCSCSSCYNETTGDKNLYSSIDEQFSQDSIGDKVDGDSKR